MYEKENDLIKEYLNKFRKGEFRLNKLLVEQREIESSEVKEEISKFQEYFRSKGITANLQFGTPQKLAIQKDGLLWSGIINGVISWYFDSNINNNNRSVEIAISETNRLNIDDDSINILKELKTYFELFTEEWINKEFNSDKEE